MFWVLNLSFHMYFNNTQKEVKARNGRILLPDSMVLKRKSLRTIDIKQWTVGDSGV